MNDEDLNLIKNRMKEKSVSIADLARFASRSYSWVGTCLRGNYPYRGASSRGAAILPFAIEQALKVYGVNFDE